MNSNDQFNAMQAMDYNLSDNLSIQWPSTPGASNNNLLQQQQQSIGCWDYWQNWYYPQVIYQSYPVYIKERAMDKGKQAFEIIKILKDKKLVKLEKVADFLDLMDELIKLL